MQTAAEFTLAIIIKGTAENFFRRAFTVIMEVWAVLPVGARHSVIAELGAAIFAAPRAKKGGGRKASANKF